MRFGLMVRLLVSGAAIMAASNASAAVLFNIKQVGVDVVATATGTFDISQATLKGQGTVFGAVSPTIGLLGLGSGSVLSYQLQGTDSFGNGGATLGVANSLTPVAIVVNDRNFFIATNYVSNSEIFSNTVFRNMTLASIGLIQGVRNYTVGGNNITVSIGDAVAAVPEPGSWAMMMLGLTAVGCAMRNRPAVRKNIKLA